MSDRIRKATGIILILSAVLLTILPTMLPASTQVLRYRSDENHTWILKKLETEQNGNVRVNEADAPELETLYGIGPSYAERIIEERENNGLFHYPEDLEAVKGIGPQTLNRFRTMLDMTIDEGGN